MISSINTISFQSFDKIGEKVIASDVDNTNKSGGKSDERFIVLPGTIQGALGGAAWDPAGTITQMEYIGDGLYEFIGIFPKGAFEYKVAVGGSWDENYGQDGVQNGENIHLNIPENDYQVRFIFDYNNKVIKDSVNNSIKKFRVPDEVKIIGLDRKKVLLQKESADLYKATVSITAGKYKYQVQYDNSEEFIYGAKGVKKGQGIKLNLDKDTEVIFVHNLQNNVTYDSVNYIPIAENEMPTIVLEGCKKVVMNDNDKDNIYIGEVVLPAGKKEHDYEIMMGEEVVAHKKIFFNEVADNYKINFSYDHRSKEVKHSYIEELEQLDNKVIGESLYFDSRDLNYKQPFGAVPQHTVVDFTLSAKTNDLERARLVVEKQKITGNQDQKVYSEKIKYPMKKVGYSKDDSREYWNVKVDFNNMGVYSYYFEAVDGDDLVFYANNTQVVSVPGTRVVGTGGIGCSYLNHDDLIRYTQTVYDPQFKTPEWAKDAIFYYIFPERFKNGDKSNDPKVGVDKFYGNKDIEVHDNWIDKPWVPGEADGHLTDDREWNNDFYGGDLEGVIEKLDYLHELGINTIYFNPIFEAPSNHKYDTANYKKIDDNFGTNDDFKRLIREAKKRDIRVILDVSLNHSGSDSIYMDRYSKYDSYGAFEDEKIRKDSDYYDWYEFREETGNPDQAYQQWANPTLANLKETDSYKNFAYRDENSVTKYWLEQGASGWRMDVTPWVSDEFWREWRKEVKEKNPEALTVAETWFDSSKYFLGDMFDSTMNYIFRQAMYDYANGETGENTVNVLEMMRENYPPEAFYCLMNLLSTHDSARALYRFGYKGEGEKAEVIMEAKNKLLLAVFFQMTYPGAPAIYYGDEVGVTGGDDPFNRGTYPWKKDGGKPDYQLLKEIKKLVHLRNEYDILRRGSVEPVYADKHVIVMLREYEGKKALVAVNNDNKAHKVSLDLSNKFDFEGPFADAFNKSNKISFRRGILQFKIPAFFGRVLIN